ncbi:MAG: protoheme IX farnesyltransferase [Gammaproteobacteria bacterium]|nr:protoheme IX farnesyltransferase [Gammaproteobacteria bacterium]
MLRLWKAYYILCKPRVVALMLLTAFVGMELAALHPPRSIVFIISALIGIALVAGSSATLNHVFEKSLDLKMRRTRKRPLPMGELSVKQALFFSGILGGGGFLILVFLVNPLTAFLALGSWLGYAFIYTKVLKPSTPHNIVLGGLAGATPPLLGCTAVSGQVEPEALLLMAIIFAWTPPHFWSLALYQQADYVATGIPMLPVTHGVPFTKLFIVLYVFLLAICSVLPFITGMSGLLYLACAGILNTIFLYFSFVLKLSDQNSKWAFRTFIYSIFYLMLLFLALWLDHLF